MRRETAVNAPNVRDERNNAENDRIERDKEPGNR
jgi:hypothetical protein